MSKASLLWGFALGLIGPKIAGSRAGKYLLHELSNHKSFQPLYNIMADRTPASLHLLQEGGLLLRSWSILVPIVGNGPKWRYRYSPRRASS
jgi:hypothetical protein